jgi:tRNA 2-thiouridine synthesizing protein A
MKTVDARGLSCPLPVMMADEAAKGPDSERIAVLVDSGTAKANVAGFLRDAGYTVEIEQSADGWYTLTAGR